MKAEQRKKDILKIIAKLKKKIPSYTTIAVVNADEEGNVVHDGMMGAFRILDGKYANYTVGIKSLDFKDDDTISLDCNCIGPDDKVFSIDDELGSIIENIINYFIALEALKVIESND